MQKFIWKVNGTTFRRENVEKVAQQIDNKKHILVTLEAEPTNPYDSNAIKVLMNGEFVGYVPKDSTDIMNEILDYAVVLHTVRKYGGGNRNIGFLITTYYGDELDEEASENL